MLSLGKFHNRVLGENYAHETSAAAEFAGEVPKFINCPHAIFRVVEIPDRARVARHQWLSQFLRWDQHCIHSHSSVDFLTQSTGAFEILLISGNDMRRLFAIVKQVREALPSKAVIPVLSHSTMKDCCALLNRGADDVLSCEMPIEEACARLHAIMRRLEWRSRLATERGEASAILERKLRTLAVGRLGPLERALLSALAEAPERVLPYSRIVSRIRRSGVQTVGGKSLFVAACNLRKKLAHNVHIVSDHGRGYALVIEDKSGIPGPVNMQRLSEKRQFYPSQRASRSVRTELLALSDTATP
jgi:DNA-binding response OmpR family regulator